MASLNKVMIIGNLGSDPEMRFTASGQALARFSVACNRRYTTRGGEQREETEWVRVVVWGRRAEIAGQYLQKGSQVYVEGRLQTRSWEDPQSGQTRYMTEVNASNFEFLGGRGQRDDWGGGGTDIGGGGGGSGYPRGGGGGGGGNSWQDGPPDFGGPDAGDLPFE